MSNKVRYPLILSLVCLASALGLAFTYKMTIPSIQKREKAKLEDALRTVMPGMQSFAKEKIEEESEDGSKTSYPFFVGQAPGATAPVGYATQVTAQGYCSKIEILVGVSPELVEVTDEKGQSVPGLKISGVKILSQQETPGLGARAEEVETDRTIWSAISDLVSGKKPEGPKEVAPWFQKQFRTKAKADLEVEKNVKPPTKHIAAITGATITSEAVTSGVKVALDRLLPIVRERCEEKCCELRDPSPGGPGRVVAEGNEEKPGPGEAPVDE